MKANIYFTLALLLLITILRLGIIAITINPGTNYRDHPIVPLVMGVLSGLVLANRPRSITGLAKTLAIALFAVAFTEVSAAILVASYTTDLSTTNPLVIMLSYWSREPAYLLFSILGVLVAIPVYWSHGRSAASNAR